MRRIVGIATTLLLALPALGILGSPAEAATAATDTAHAAATAAQCTSTDTVVITQLAFNPATVMPGQTSMLNLTAVNCTSQPLKLSLESYGRFQNPSVTTGIPPGCPAIDPFVQPATFAANGTYTASISYPVFTGCTATSLQGIVQFLGGSGATLPQGSALLTIVQSVPPAPCHVTYMQTQWTGGFTAAITITNTGFVPVNGWTLTFTFGGDQKITYGWNAAIQQTGSAVSLTNAPYNTTIAPGASASGIGFQGTWSASNAAPFGFKLNGAVCS